MSLIRLIQESGAIKDGPIFSLKSLDFEIENLKQIIKEKDVIIENNNAKLQEVENQLYEYKEQYTIDVKHTPQTTNAEQVNLHEKLLKLEEYSKMPIVIQKYEKFISEITANHEIAKEQRDIASSHLAALEFAFADLVNKYERLKTIIVGYQQNQETLLDQVESYKDVVKVLQGKYENFKQYANQKLKEANDYVEKIDKKHISELAKVKSKVLQSKVKISELEKTISVISTNASTGDAGPDTNRKSVFAPLPSTFCYN